jgi:quercetin dioxygenase-like cupin family protein
MRQKTWLPLLAASAMISVLAMAPAGDAQVGLERKIVLQQDLKMPGYETVVAEVTLAVGAREGRHTHPGTLIGYLLQGELTLEVEGQPTKVYKAGDAALIPAGVVHEGRNTGSVPTKVIATFIVEKGKPLSTPAPAN